MLKLIRPYVCLPDCFGVSRQKGKRTNGRFTQLNEPWQATVYSPRRTARFRWASDELRTAAALEGEVLPDGVQCHRFGALPAGLPVLDKIGTSVVSGLGPSLLDTIPAVTVPELGFVLELDADGVTGGNPRPEALIAGNAAPGCLALRSRQNYIPMETAVAIACPLPYCGVWRRTVRGTIGCSTLAPISSLEFGPPSVGRRRPARDPCPQTRPLQLRRPL